ncbi:hypothetical protein DFH07DRAFT_968198 [Mycena maculata]|uniref:Uncharacterized protein n=1 Tax=Mycena maculata TaxID=230809 RepID=A0AAD7MUA7_9AGAR|nr:hypothetical protein DFH07DRAFT_968198 [Mycena maculata]
MSPSIGWFRSICLGASTILRNQSLEIDAIGGGIQDRTFQLALSLNQAAKAVYVTSNIMADAIFIFRCYAVWNSRIRIVLLPIILTIALAVFGYTDAVSQSFFFYDNYTASLTLDAAIATSVFTTFVLMGLSAGRIWWLARSARQVMGRKITGKYYTICAMILESGALYCVGGIAYVIVAEIYPATTSGAVLGQLVGIAPTIIAVRVGLGQSVESVNSFVATARPRACSPLEFRPAVASADAIESQMMYIRPESDHDSGKAEAV